LVAHLVWDQGAAGSNPATRTMNIQSHDILRVQVHTVILDSIDNKKLISEINETSNSIPAEFVDSFGTNTNHTYFEDSTFPWAKPESSKLLSKIEDSVSAISCLEMNISEAWTLSLGFGQSVMAHSHRMNNHMDPSEFYSVAYYANAPENSAKLIFEIGHSNISESIYVIEPENSMLVIFNSYMKHMTTRHLSEEKRVVVSANLAPRNPSTVIVPDLSGYKVV
jgi:hypothetical protein